MKYFKDTNNKLHVIDAEFIHLLPGGCNEISKEEYILLSKPAPLTIEQIAANFEAAIQAYLDAQAQSKGYDNITTACSYAAATNPFQAEAISFVTWRGNVWHYCYGELAKVQSGTRTMPTVEKIISELPLRIIPND